MFSCERPRAKANPRRTSNRQRSPDFGVLLLVKSVGRYWRYALVVFFNFGADTGTLWEALRFHEPNRRRHVSCGRHARDREIRAPCPWSWLYYPRVKTQNAF